MDLLPTTASSLAIPPPPPVAADMHFLASTCLASLALLPVCTAAPTTPPACSRDALAGVLPAEATIVSADVVNAGGQYGEGARNLAYPDIPTNLPELCALVVNVTSSPISSFRLGMFLPMAEAWNERFLVVGNGGFGGGINWIDASAGARYGFATVSTDTGHNSTAGDVTWATNDETKQDWGHRAIHGAATLGKTLAAAYYGVDRPIQRSYYSGCSTGGRQGLREAQLHPDTFDGLLVGAPAWYTSHLQTWTLRVGALNLPADAPHHIPPQLFSAIGAEALRQCDGADGVLDGIVSQPELCKLDLTTILCKAGNTTNCLTPAQLDTATKVYADYEAEGRFAFPGLSISSEAVWFFLLGGAEPSSYGTQYVQYMLLNDPAWSWEDYTDAIVWQADAENPGNATAHDYDMSAFAARGGRIVMYHGVADSLIPQKSSHVFYDRVADATGDGVDGLRSWFRYFDVPGMGHCSGSSVGAPTYFAGANQAVNLGTATYSVPGFSDAEHDALLAMVRWVETGEAPDKIIATAWKSQNDPNSGVSRQRPLCPFPEVARWDGKGDVNAARSWSCI